MDIMSPKNNRWTYTDTTTRFKIGDVINYWLFVEYKNGKHSAGYTSEFRRFNVTGRRVPSSLFPTLSIKLSN